MPTFENENQPTKVSILNLEYELSDLQRYTKYLIKQNAIILEEIDELTEMRENQPEHKKADYNDWITSWRHHIKGKEVLIERNNQDIQSIEKKLKNMIKNDA